MRNLETQKTAIPRRIFSRLRRAIDPLRESSLARKAKAVNERTGMPFALESRIQQDIAKDDEGAVAPTDMYMVYPPHGLNRRAAAHKSDR